mmetsp:Transcript_87415/g.245383  ORF Transcript_87415/g.245383 Transcript_87415/m.245383 type:complete len:157 (+) Transcript_87415:111-581(+)
MGLGKISFLDLEFDFDEMATTLSSMNFTGPVEYDPETAQLPDLMMRLCAFGMAMLLGVSVTMLLSSADLRQSPPKYALTFACCVLMLPRSSFRSVHSLFQGLVMWRALLVCIWMIVLPWTLMQKLVLAVQASRQSRSEAGFPGRLPASDETTKKKR